MRVDLHCHSTFSDGQLTPNELLKLADENQIELFSITDHDNFDAHLSDLNQKTKCRLITGIEFSTTWNKTGIHIIGLNFDIKSTAIINAVTFQKKARVNRAKKISLKLEKIGLDNAYDKLVTRNKNKQIGRPDFANLLVKEGFVKDFQHAFKKYLGSGKIGDKKNDWLDLDQIINAIKQSGGIAILAHPLYYKLTNAKLIRLLNDFKNFGGLGLEVVNGYQNTNKTQYLSKLCVKLGLKASIGSDFHQLNNWNKLGCDSRLLNNIQFIWEDF